MELPFTGFCVANVPDRHVVKNLWERVSEPQPGQPAGIWRAAGGNRTVGMIKTLRLRARGLPRKVEKLELPIQMQRGTALREWDLCPIPCIAQHVSLIGYL